MGEDMGGNEQAYKNHPSSNYWTVSTKHQDSLKKLLYYCYCSLVVQCNIKLDRSTGMY